MRQATAMGMLVLATVVVAAAQPGVGQGAAAPVPLRAAVSAGGLIYVSGTLGTDENGRIVPGGIKAQTRAILDKLSRSLAQVRSGIDRAASVTVYLKNVSDFAAMNEVYATYWPKDPPARTTVGANLVVPDALVEISMVTVADGSERRAIHPADWVKAASPYSYGIKSGDTLFLAGLVSRNGKDNSIVLGDIASQTATVLDNASAILAAAGMGLADVVSSRVYIGDTALFEGINVAYRRYFPKDPPARATVGAGLTDPHYLIEIALTAVKGAERRPITTPNADGTPGQANPNLSSAIRVGSRLYLSGMLGNGPATRDDVKGQTGEALARIGRTLQASGFDWNHVVDSTVFLTDVSRFAGMNEPYRMPFGTLFPARATVGVGLVAPDALVEIMMTAVR